MNEKTLLDFFCGAGGFTEGFRQYGFEPIYGYDNWQPAIDTYNLNHDLNCVPTDILELSKDVNRILALPNTMVILGSPPCVSFSVANTHGDKKAQQQLGMQLIHAFLRIVAVKKNMPGSILKYWFMENVSPSRKALKEEYTFDDLGLREWAWSIGYQPSQIALRIDTNAPLMNSWDFGSFQRRKRLVVGTPLPGVKKYMVSEAERKTLGGFLESFPAPMPKPTPPLVNPVHDPNFPNHIALWDIEVTDHFYDSGLSYPQWEASFDKAVFHPTWNSVNAVADLDSPAPTVVASFKYKGRGLFLIRTDKTDPQADGLYRQPTVRELACFQGFPITYQFQGKNLTEKGRLVGNAVCTHVSSALARAVLDELGDEKTFRPMELKGTPLVDLGDGKEKDYTRIRRRKNSRFKRAIFKGSDSRGPVCIISNYDVRTKESPSGNWYVFKGVMDHNGKWHWEDYTMCEAESHSVIYPNVTAELLQESFESNLFMQDGVFSNPIDMCKLLRHNDSLDDTIREASRIISKTRTK